jgi:nicotinate-nucleotide adenylyltransferase
MAHLLIYGGTFDPIHHGHLITCRRARELLGADAVVLIPARVSPHKLQAAPTTGAQRLAMIERAIAGEADFRVDGRELSRDGPSYTFDTLAALAAERPGDRLTLLIGADQLPKFSTWHRVEELLGLVGVAVLGRPGVVMPAGGGAGRFTPLQTPLIDISATAVRERVAAGLPITYLVPAGVAEYIAAEGLYRGARV